MSYVEVFKRKMKQLVSETSLTDISKKTKISPASISRYITDDANPVLDKVDTIEQVMGKPEGWLLSEKENCECDGSTRIGLYYDINNIIQTKRKDPDLYMYFTNSHSINDKSVCLKVNTNSMEPTINQSDIIILSEYSDKQIAQGIYIVQTGQGINIGRIMVADEDRVNIISDNKEYPMINIKQSMVKIRWRVVGLLRNF